MTTHQTSMADNPVFLGWEPILDRDQRIVAYELLFRTAGGGNAAVIEDHFTATAEVVVRTNQAQLQALGWANELSVSTGR